MVRDDGWGVDRIARERKRQVKELGYSREDEIGEDLRLSALVARHLDRAQIAAWAQASGYTQIEELVKAGALIGAMIDAVLMKSEYDLEEECALNDQHEGHIYKRGETKVLCKGVSSLEALARWAEEHVDTPLSIFQKESLQKFVARTAISTDSLIFHGTAPNDTTYRVVDGPKMTETGIEFTAERTDIDL